MTITLCRSADYSDPFSFVERDSLPQAVGRKISHEIASSSIGGDSIVSADGSSSLSHQDATEIKSVAFDTGSFADFDSVNWASQTSMEEVSSANSSVVMPSLEQQVHNLHFNPFHAAPNHAHGATFPNSPRQQQQNPINVHQNFVPVGISPALYHHHAGQYSNSSIFTPTQPQQHQAHDVVSQSENDRYAALANLDAEIKTAKIVEKRGRLQKQISLGQQIFGAAPSSVNPFLTKNPSNAANIQPNMNLYQTNPFTAGQSDNPFM